MSMPPSGSDQRGMDEEAIIEAEIQFELDNINLDDDLFVDNDDVVDDVVEADDIVSGHDFNIPDEVDDYVKRIQDQTNRFEQELNECDELLLQSDKYQGSSNGLSLIPYEDQQLLGKLAGELGYTVEEYKKKILEDIEQDNFEIKDELAEFIDDEEEVYEANTDTKVDDQLAITDGQAGVQTEQENIKLESDIGKAVEEGIVSSEIPVTQDMLPTGKRQNGTTNSHLEIQQMLREQLEKLESRYEERLEKMKKEGVFYKNEEEVRQKRLDEERLWKKQELEREEQKLKLEQELSERKVEEDKSQRETQLREEIKQFEKEMADFQAETVKEKEELERNMEIERQKQIDKRNKAALMIQKTYRGHRIRQTNKPVLDEKREVRIKEKEERRIREVEQEIFIRNEDKKRKEEEERLKVEEEKKKQEEIKRQKELEKQQREEEKRRKKEEEERKKQEEKQRKEEEKQRKKEEERKRKEEEKKRKEEEERRKKEAKRLKEEQERQRKEEEKLKKEEEKRRKEEEKRLMEEERKRKIEEERGNPEEKVDEKKEIVNNGMDGKGNGILQKNDKVDSASVNKDLNSCDPTSDITNEKCHVNGESISSQSVGNLNSDHVQLNDLNTKQVSNENFQNTDTTVRNNISEHDIRKGYNKENHLSNNYHNPADKDNDELTGEMGAQEVIVNPPQSATVTETGVRNHSEISSDRVKLTDCSNSMNDKQEILEKLQKSGHIPHPPSPRKTNKSNHQSKVHGKQDHPIPSVDTANIDCLPEQVECLRLKFMKECQPWSKVSNEPWKLKAGLSKKPLRRPSSAKKLPLLPDTAILQAARVASLQQVTTVQLCDLPGNNISPLGQCWGLKYLSMCNCNLVALDGLGQCKQLQYIDVKNNKIEYIDLKDVGQLQYLNVSHNKLSSIHGVDNCSSLRWINLSHNNITKLGGLETLRRLNTLILSHNQLINAEGLGATPTLQIIDMSHNHLQEITDLDKLCLLLSLDLSSNNLLKIPYIKNQVLLQDLNLCDNSISTVEEFSTAWLPLLNTLDLSMNSLDTLPSLHNCLTLKKLDVSNNQITEFDTISKGVESCLYLEHLLLEDNPVMAEFDASHIQTLEKFCPRLHAQDNSKSKDPIKPRTSFELMCLTQGTIYKDVRNHFDATLRTLSEQDLALISDSHHKYCEKLFNTAVEHRYAHEYGEVTVTMPTAPTTPKSGRPKSGRQKDSYASPKDMFENALKASSRPNGDSSVNNHSVSVVSQDSNPKDLFEQALKSAESVHTNRLNQHMVGAAINGVNKIRMTDEEKRLKAIITIQAYWRGWLVRHEIAEHMRIWLAATAIQACWRGYIVRKQLKNASSFNNIYRNLPPAVLQHMNKSATKIQAIWRGYNLRRKLLAALEYAQCNFEDEEDEDAMMFGDDFDLDKFMALDQNLLDEEWKPPDTPDIPSHHAVLKKPPSGRAKIPPIPLNNVGPPNNPRRAWRNIESPLTDVDKISRPPSSVASTDLTARTHVSKKEEKLTEEWGFKDTNTAHLMVQRAKKMKYNAERRNKISKLDPKQRLALFRKLEEVTHPRTVPVPQRKTLPRKEYFKARQQEIYRQEQEKQEEYNVKASRTFEWLHTQVGDHVVSDSIINKGYVDGPSYVPQNFPELHGTRRVQLTSPGSLDLQSVDSVSSAGHKTRRASLGTAGSTSSSKLPPIQTSSAPTQHVKERMSFRNPRVNQSVGWGGGKKRGSIL